MGRFCEDFEAAAVAGHNIIEGKSHKLVEIVTSAL